MRLAIRTRLELDQARFREHGHLLEHRHFRQLGDGFDGGQTGSSAARTQTPKEPPRSGIEQPIAPFERRAQRALALGCIERPASQQRQTTLQSAQQGGRGKRTKAHCGELECERDPLEATADGGNRRCILGRQQKAVGPPVRVLRTV